MESRPSDRVETLGAYPPELLEAVRALHAQIQDLQLPLDLPGMSSLREQQQRALRLLESYALPRLGSANNPLVVVIGGPTGSGKSTLTNSLVGEQASATGLTRPTTVQPVLAYNPADAAALHALGLFRAPSQTGGADASSWVQLRAVPTQDLTPGLALIDSPDLDSRVGGNRELAMRLLDVADLWLFVTTGTSYHDSMSWELLAEAARRDLTIAVVLNRLREAEFVPVRNHFAALLTQAGFAKAPVFTIPEASLSEERVPLLYTTPLLKWLERQATNINNRQQLVSQAFDGTLDQAAADAYVLADAMAAQTSAVRRFQVDLEAAFSAAREAIRTRTTDASLIREEVINAWRTTNTRADAAGNSPSADLSAPNNGLLFRRRARGPQPEPGHESYLAISRALNSSLSEALRGQLAQTQWQVAERWEPLRALPNEQFKHVAEITPDFNDRVGAATLAWLTSVQHRVYSAGIGLDPAAALHPTVDPLTLAIASLAAEGRPGRTVALSEAAAARSDRLREQLGPALVTVRENDRLPFVVRDSWLDLLHLMHQVLAQDEARLAALVAQVQVSPAAPVRLLQSVSALSAARDLPRTSVTLAQQQVHS